MWSRQTLEISTHTLTWSVTGGRISAVKGNFNFNSHAHVERDPIMRKSSSIPINFNSHAHVERDGQGRPLHPLSEISTHTLTWSVTPNAAEVRQLKPISTHTLTWSVTTSVSAPLPMP